MPVKSSKQNLGKKTPNFKSETFQDKQKRAMEIYR
ncbi:MAG: hypothetical protein RL677_809, partial [Actinomycetota bacterium]